MASSSSVVISFWSSAGEDLEKARGRCVETAFLSADEHSFPFSHGFSCHGAAMS